ncbi:hypothetical protein B1B04_08670 [Lysinibacillus sp. KCTC 33748]|uniref:hypothetical protein n=1 Tax=unclassified Lysinibacillus TaxID=2636778 RepID=UPI0009A805FE|nr:MULTISPECIES: hypothetical protein [unclassified Lysinibacillus]OXS74948.1 hypothetical protein B1B04_08670 [Lysinibacillus sp. KCTC 33748]SKB60435.1 hypothetical protein SAMN06295926_104216 [Lysinibacillus sp. AC-3]
MGLIIVSVVLVICIFTVTLVVIQKHSKEDIKLEVTAVCEGVNEIGQAIMKIYFTFSIGKLAQRKKEIIGSIDWSQGWMPVCYNLKENGVYQEQRLLRAVNETTYTTFEINATNDIDHLGRGEGYVVLVLEDPISTDKSRAGVILAVTANLVTYQLSDSTSWNNDFAVNQ